MEVLHTWGPDIFHLTEVAGGNPLTPVTYTILKVSQVARALIANTLQAAVDCLLSIFGSKIHKIFKIIQFCFTVASNAQGALCGLLRLMIP